MLADSVGLALLVVLGTLTPAERVASSCMTCSVCRSTRSRASLGRSPTAARQLASRAPPVRVQGADAVADGNVGRRREIVDAFLAASRGGDFEALLALLDPMSCGPAWRAAELVGATAVAGRGRARAARAAPTSAGWCGLNAAAALLFGFTIADGKITGIELVADADIVSRGEVARS